MHIPWEVFLDALHKFYSPESRIIKHSKGKFAIRKTEQGKIDRTIRSYMFYFIRDYARIAINIDIAFDSNENYKKFEEMSEFNILPEQAQSIYD